MVLMNGCYFELGWRFFDDTHLISFIVFRARGEGVFFLFLLRPSRRRLRVRNALFCLADA